MRQLTKMLIPLIIISCLMFGYDFLVSNWNVFTIVGFATTIVGILMYFSSNIKRIIRKPKEPVKFDSKEEVRKWQEKKDPDFK